MVLVQILKKRSSQAFPGNILALENLHQQSTCDPVHKTLAAPTCWHGLTNRWCLRGAHEGDNILGIDRGRLSFYLDGSQGFQDGDEHVLIKGDHAIDRVG